MGVGLTVFSTAFCSDDNSRSSQTYEDKTKWKSHLQQFLSKKEQESKQAQRENFVWQKERAPNVEVRRAIDGALQGGLGLDLARFCDSSGKRALGDGQERRFLDESDGIPLALLGGIDLDRRAVIVARIP